MPLGKEQFVGSQLGASDDTLATRPLCGLETRHFAWFEPFHGGTSLDIAWLSKASHFWSVDFPKICASRLHHTGFSKVGEPKITISMTKPDDFGMTWWVWDLEYPHCLHRQGWWPSTMVVQCTPSLGVLDRFSEPKLLELRGVPHSTGFPPFKTPGYGSIPIDTFLVGWTSINPSYFGVH